MLFKVVRFLLRVALTQRDALQEPTEEPPGALRGDEFTVAPYVMKPEDRGTARDPRAASEEQWSVTEKMTNNLRQFDVQATRTQFDKLREGDKVYVVYRVGKYTGTVWTSEIQ